MSKKLSILIFWFKILSQFEHTCKKACKKTPVENKTLVSQTARYNISNIHGCKETGRMCMRICYAYV